MCGVKLRPDASNPFEELSAPYKQCTYLLGLMLGTPEPTTVTPSAMDNLWHRACELLQRVYALYSFTYFPQEGEDSQSDEWYLPRSIAMPTFLHFFSSTRVACSIEQVRDRIIGLFVPFDAELRTTLGLSASDLLEVAEAVEALLQQRADDMYCLGKRAEDLRMDFIRRAQLNKWGRRAMQIEASKDPVKEATVAFIQSMDDLFLITLDDLANGVGEEKATAFWRQFTSRRGEQSSFTYVTESNPAEQRPLFSVGEHREALCPVFNSVYHAAIELFTSTLRKGNCSKRWLKRRDKFLEEKTGEIFKRFVPDGKFFQSAFERRDAHLEHDLIVLWN